MVRRLAGMLAVAFVVTAGCATTGTPRGGPGSTVQLMMPDNVGWEPGGPFEIPMTVFNATRMPLAIAQPDRESVEFTLYRPDRSVACKSPKVSWRQVEGWKIQRVRPLTGMSYRIDVQTYCRDLPGGEYRYEVSFMAASAGGGFADVVWTGTLGPLGGRALLREGASGLKYDELVAALDGKPAATGEPAPAGEEGATADAAKVEVTNAPADAAKVEVTNAPADAAKVVGAASAPADAVKAPAAADPSTVRACVDHELAARGLNAYGDPKGTSYANGPPTDEYGRVLYVAARSPAIRRACQISGF